MKTKVIEVDAVSPDPAALEKGAEVLARGGLVAFPTETVYGLGADARRADAVARIFEAKGRPARNPLIVHVDAPPVANGGLVSHWPPIAELLSSRFWPGPLTLVLRKDDSLPSVVTGGGSTVAVRIPNHPVARGLLSAARMPIAAPSANRSQRISPTRAEHVLAQLEGRVDLVLDGGPTPGGIESTVLDVTSTPPVLLRPGLINRAKLEAVVGPLGSTRGSLETLRSPGLLDRHYAPVAQVRLVPGDGAVAVREALSRGRRVGWLSFHPTGFDGVFFRSMKANPDGYAAELYSALHDCDRADCEEIVIDLPPMEPVWDAIHDRLRRAAFPSDPSVTR